MTSIPKSVAYFARRKLKIKGSIETTRDSEHTGRGAFAMKYDISPEDLCVRLEKLAEKYSDIIDDYKNNQDCILIRFKDRRNELGTFDVHYRSLYFRKGEFNNLYVLF